MNRPKNDTWNVQTGFFDFRFFFACKHEVLQRFFSWLSFFLDFSRWSQHSHCFGTSGCAMEGGQRGLRCGSQSPRNSSSKIQSALEIVIPQVRLLVQRPVGITRVCVVVYLYLTCLRFFQIWPATHRWWTCSPACKRQILTKQSVRNKLPNSRSVMQIF